VVSFTLWPLCLQGRDPPVPTGCVAGSAPELVWIKRSENSWPCWDSNFDPSVIQPIASCHINWATAVLQEASGDWCKHVLQLYIHDHVLSFYYLIYKPSLLTYYLWVTQWLWKSRILFQQFKINPSKLYITSIAIQINHSELHPVMFYNCEKTEHHSASKNIVAIKGWQGLNI
jgi:hypothetical protein